MQPWRKDLADQKTSHRMMPTWSKDRMEWLDEQGVPKVELPLADSLDWEDRQVPAQEDVEINEVSGEIKAPVRYVSGLEVEPVQVFMGSFEVEPDEEEAEELARLTMMQMNPRQRYLEMNVAECWKEAATQKVKNIVKFGPDKAVQAKVRGNAVTTVCKGLRAKMQRTSWTKEAILKSIVVNIKKASLCSGNVESELVVEKSCFGFSFFVSENPNFFRQN